MLEVARAGFAGDLLVLAAEDEEDDVEDEEEEALLDCCDCDCCCDLAGVVDFCSCDALDLPAVDLAGDVPVLPCFCFCSCCRVLIF